MNSYSYKIDIFQDKIIGFEGHLWFNIKLKSISSHLETSAIFINKYK